MTNPAKDYQSMTDWLRNTISRLPEKYGNILFYDTLTGLRPDEARKSIALIHNSLDEYLNKGSFVLEHFKYPKIFIRRTKKAYVSIVTDSILNIAKPSSSCGYNVLRLAVRRKGLDMYIGYCRKVFATYLRLCGVGGKYEVEAEAATRAEKSVGTHTIFWSVYDKLEKLEQEDPSNHMSVDKNTISHKKLHQALVSSGHFYQGDATQIIRDMVKAGMLEVVSFETYRRGGSSSNQ